MACVAAQGFYFNAKDPTLRIQTDSFFIKVDCIETELPKKS